MHISDKTRQAADVLETSAEIIAALEGIHGSWEAAVAAWADTPTLDEEAAIILALAAHDSDTPLSDYVWGTEGSNWYSRTYGTAPLIAAAMSEIASKPRPNGDSRLVVVTHDGLGNPSGYAVYKRSGDALLHEQAIKFYIANKGD